METDCRVVAATVIRVAPTGFTAPYVLAAVRTGQGLSLGVVDVGPEAVPAPGTALQPVGEQDGTPVYRPASA